MFSGIVEGKGSITHCTRSAQGARLVVRAGPDYSEVKSGDSIAVNGACLTVVESARNTVAFDVVNETLRRTTLGKLTVGSEVNLERSLKLGDRIHGHIVSGHIDGVIKVMSRLEDGNSIQYSFDLPKALRPYLAEKGSVSLAGVSLTVGEVTAKSFCVYIIPHTAHETILGALTVGSEVNVEVDLFARYIESYLSSRS